MSGYSTFCPLQMSLCVMRIEWRIFIQTWMWFTLPSPGLCCSIQQNMLLKANRTVSTRRSTTCRFTGQYTSVMSKLLILLSAKGHLQLSPGGARDSKGLKGTADMDERECLSNYKTVNLHFYKSGMTSLSHRKGSATWVAHSPLQRTGISQLTSLDQPMFPLCY